MDNLFDFAVAGMKAQAAVDKLCHQGDPETSREAAKKMVDSGALSAKENQVYQWILSYLDCNDKKDFTAKELVWWLYSNKYHTIEHGIGRLVLRVSRLSGLHRKGKINRTGEKRDGCAVWRLL